MTFSEKLVRLRKLKGITQDEFASAVGVSRQAVYKWESGQSYPEVPKLIEMKLLFGISIDDLLDESFEVVMPEKKTVRRRRESVKLTVTPPTAADGTVEAEVKEPVPVAEPVDEAAPAEIKQPEVAATPAEEPAEQKPSEEPASSEAAPEKKRGFFSRLFRR